MGTNSGGGSYDQVVPNDPHNPTPSPPHIINCASEVEITSSNEVVQTQAHVNFETPTGPVTVMEVPIAVHHANIPTDLNPKGLVGRGCSKVVVETVKSIPMDFAHSTVTAASDHAGSYELISHDGSKEIDFTMF